jgi:hypothetical protein
MSPITNTGLGSGVYAAPPPTASSPPTLDPRVSTAPRLTVPAPAAPQNSSLKLIVLLLLIAVLSAGAVVTWQLLVRHRALVPPARPAPAVVAPEPAPAPAGS